MEDEYWDEQWEDDGDEERYECDRCFDRGCNYCLMLDY